ncbi:MAG: O-antigen ligase family protein [Armatimonadetes bacterium]|nr:O-antigen ligase family protein [Armatimonadota bacterium]
MRQRKAAHNPDSYRTPLNLWGLVYVASLTSSNAGPVLSALNYGVASLLLCILAVRLMVVGSLAVPRLIAIPLAFFGYALVSALWAPDSSVIMLTGKPVLLTLIGTIAIWLALYNGMSWKALVLGALVGSAILVVTLVQGDTMMGGIRREAGIRENANSAAMFLVIYAFLMASSPAGQMVGWWRIPVASAVIACSLLYTGSRKTLFSIAVFAALVVLDIASRTAKTRSWALVLAGLLTLSALVIWAGSDSTRAVDQFATIGAVQRLERLLEGSDPSGSERLDMFHTAMNLWEQRPWFGHGLGQFARMTWFDMYCHNNYAELLCNDGIVGLLLFYAFHMFLLARAAGGALRGRVHLQKAVLMIVLAMLFDIGSVSYYTRIYWLMLVAADYFTSTQSRPRFIVLGAPARKGRDASESFLHRR